MKKLIYIFLTIVVIGCSTKKDAFLNRKWHAMNTKYNTLYNGNLAFEDGLRQLNTTYQDDFWQVLPIEPLEIKEQEIAIPQGMVKPKEQGAASTAQGFERAEEKAVKAIQKHSMNIRGDEKNTQIDDAYLLLGKGRYYSQRFVPALEAFTYVLENYPSASLINETKIWRAKTLVRLQNEDLAIETMQYMLKKKDLDDEILENAHTAMAMAYRSKDSVEAVIKHLNLATLSHKNKEQFARNKFILGQLYNKAQKIDSSQMAFQELIDMRKIPKKYQIYAHVEQAKNYHLIKENNDELVKTLKKLIRDRDNRPYLDALYYQLGLTYKKDNKSKAAEESFFNSAHAKNAGAFQRSLSYEQLGNLSFDKAAFVNAGAYYDTVMQLSENQNTKRIRRLIRKRKKLEDVIVFENVKQRNDSILNVVAMNENERKEYFGNHIEVLKKEAEKQQNILLNTGFSGGVQSNNPFETGKGKWYFYNVQSVGFGQQEFKKVWGNRPLEDNWRLSDKTQINTKSITPEAEKEDPSRKYDLTYYLERIPKQAKQIDSVKTKRDNAYYQLGLIYKEQFKENTLAINRFEKLLSFTPSEKLALPTKYQLYKIYQDSNPAKAELLKNDIIKNYPNTKYASILSNPEAYVESLGKESDIEAEYKKVYNEYLNEQFENVIQACSEAIKKYASKPIVSKYELLKAYAIGKTQGKEPFINSLEFVALNYANTVEGKHAQDVLTTLEGKEREPKGGREFDKGFYKEQAKKELKQKRQDPRGLGPKENRKFRNPKNNRKTRNSPKTK